MSYMNAVQFQTAGGNKQFTWNGDAPQICAQPYMQALAEGDISGHTAWTKIGYALMPATTETDIYSYGGTIPVIPLMTTAALRRVVSAHADDHGVVLRGDATGDTVHADADSSETILHDADVDFEAGGGTVVTAGCCVLLDPHGAVPEWGYVTSVAQYTLTIANGFSAGGTAASRHYAVLDYAAHPGAQAVLLNYLDGAYATKRELVVTNGAQANGVLTVNADIFRLNSFRVIATGSAGKSAGALSLGNNATPPTIIYGYITAGYTRGRSSLYTVPANKTLYITAAQMSFGSNAANKAEYCRLYLRAAQYTTEDGTVHFRTNIAPGVVLWYPYSEVVVANSVVQLSFESPIKILPSVSVKVSGAASGAGVATVGLRGWLE
jgi:hypothetical protein